MVNRYTEIVNDVLLPTNIDTFVEGKPCPCDVFARSEDGALKPLFNKDMIFDASTISFLKKKGISEVYVKAHDLYEIERNAAKPATAPAPSPQEEEPPAPVKPPVFDGYTEVKIKHYQIDKSLLVPGSEVAFNIYALDYQRIHPLVEASEQSPRKIDLLVSAIEGDLVIDNADIPLYQSYLNAMLASRELPPKERSKMQSIAIKENSKLIIKDLLENPRSGEKIKESVTVVNKMVDNILDNGDAIYELLSIRSHDYYTYTHSVNVAALSVGLGIAAGLSRSELEKLGIGTMLHDLGKSAIPLEILNKQGKLSDDEFRIMKTHVIESENILRRQKDIPEESYVAVIQHHEKISGKGYPYGLSGAEVKLFGRISAIADCYDAITTKRSYKPAFTPFHALSIIVNETGHYDADLLAVFIKMLGKLT